MDLKVDNVVKIKDSQGYYVYFRIAEIYIKNGGVMLKVNQHFVNNQYFPAIEVPLDFITAPSRFCQVWRESAGKFTIREV